MNSDFGMNMIISLLGAGMIAMLMLYFAAKNGWLAKFLSNLYKPSEKALKKQSDNLLAEMDRNVAERKSRNNT